MRVILLVLLLVGCTSTPVPFSAPVVHPELPRPYQVCNDIEWLVKIEEKETLVALTYEDSISLAICLEDLERYMSELKEVACFYRQDCKENHDNNKTN